MNNFTQDEDYTKAASASSWSARSSSALCVHFYSPATLYDEVHHDLAARCLSVWEYLLSESFVCSAKLLLNLLSFKSFRAYIQQIIALMPHRQWAGLVAGGILMGLAPVNAWPLAWVSLVPLWTSIFEAMSHRSDGLRVAVLSAVVWGMAYHGTALSWITGVHPMTWLGIPWFWSIAIALGSWLFITLWGTGIGLTWAIATVLSSRWRQLSAPAQVFVGTALWCAVEWVWSRSPLYWTSLSYTQSPGNLVGLHLGQVMGPSALTASIVAVNGLIAVSISPYLSSEKELQTGGYSSWSQSLQLRYLVGAIAIWSVLHGIGWVLYQQPLANRDDTALKVGLIQGNLPTAYKMTPSGIQASRRVYIDGYEALADEGADMVVTPEGSIPEAWNAFLQDQNVLLRAVTKRRVPLVLGTFARKDIDDWQSPLAQSLLTLVAKNSTSGTAGEIAGRYNKVKLVPLGEYMPLESILGWLSPFGDSLSPGTFDQQLNTPFGPMAAGICYESAFAELFRQQVKQGGLAILTASNNDPYPPRQMMQHHGQDVMRAIESDRWMVRVTNTGISAIVDPHGRTLWQAEAGEYATHIAQIYRREGQTLYVRYGDWLTPLLLILTIGLYIRR